jgi:hypothetical protein
MKEEALERMMEAAVQRMEASVQCMEAFGSMQAAALVFRTLVWSVECSVQPFLSCQYHVDILSETQSDQ